jgi:hypothetical protein
VIAAAPVIAAATPVIAAATPVAAAATPVTTTAVIAVSETKDFLDPHVLLLPPSFLELPIQKEVTDEPRREVRKIGSKKRQQVNVLAILSWRLIRIALPTFGDSIDRCSPQMVDRWIATAARSYKAPYLCG